jgi:hypothetical protein
LRMAARDPVDSDIPAMNWAKPALKARQNPAAGGTRV